MRHISYKIPQNHSFRFFIKTKNGTRFKMAVPYIDDNTRTEKFLFFLFFFSFLRKILTRRETYSHMYALNVLKKKKNVFLSTLSFTTSNLETNFVGNFRKRVRRREARWGDLPRYVRRVDASTGW